MKFSLQGALLSSFIPSVLVLWMIVGGELYGEQDKPLPLPTSQCPHTLDGNGTSNTTLFPHIISVVTDGGYRIADNNSDSVHNRTERLVQSTPFIQNQNILFHYIYIK